MKRNQKWEIPHTVLERRTLCFSSYKKLQIKSKTVMSWSSRKKEHFLYRLLCLKDFLLTFVLFQCIVYWIHCQNIPTFTYQKKLLHTLFCLFLKSLKTFSVSLIPNTAQKMKFSIMDFFSKCDQIRRKLRIWSHLQKKS